MKKLIMLVPRHYGFDTQHNTSIILDSVLPLLRQEFDVEIIWFVFMPERMKNKSNNSQFNFVEIHDFQNAVDVLKKAKPDIVFDSEFPSLIDIAFDKAAKSLNIPVISRVSSADPERNTKFQFFTSFLPLFFHNSLPYEENSKKQFARRGRFFLFKYLFLIRSLRASNFSLLKTIEYFFRTLKWHISITTPFLDVRFANTLHFLENENLVNDMIEKGFSKSSLVVTGNPIYDHAFQKYSKLENTAKIENKIRILFVPMQLYEGGIWTKKQRDHTIIEIIKQISKNKSLFSVIVKLHPTSQRLDEYQSLIHSIDNSIPIYQKGIISDYLDDVDVVVSYGTLYSSLLFSLIAHKPLIICNFFGFKPITKINTNVAWKCTSPTDLVKIINGSLLSYSTNYDKIETYLKDIMYKTDGFAAQRLCNAISNLINRNK
jgi:hypothetical protein